MLNIQVSKTLRRLRRENHSVHRAPVLASLCRDARLKPSRSVGRFQRVGSSHLRRPYRHEANVVEAQSAFSRVLPCVPGVHSMVGLPRGGRDARQKRGYRNNGRFIAGRRSERKIADFPRCGDRGLDRRLPSYRRGTVVPCGRGRGRFRVGRAPPRNSVLFHRSALTLHLA